MNNVFSSTATGVPLQQAPMFVAGQPLQFGLGPMIDPAVMANFRTRGGARDGGRQGRRRGHGLSRAASNVLDATARAEAMNRERAVDNLIASPAFWATVFTTLQQHPNIAEEVRRDLEEQERRAAEARERRRRGRRQQDETRTNSNENGSGNMPDERRRQPPPTVTPPDPGGAAGHHDEYGNDPEEEPTVHAENLPDLYGFLADDMANIRQTAGVQRLDLLLDELDLEALWSARDVMISFGPLTRILLRLFIGPYATDEENLIVRMLNLAVERASKNFGFEDYQANRPQVVEPFIVTYRRRGRMLRDFSAFRYMLEITENMGRIGRKHKTDLILLYMTLTTPEVRLHRRWNTDSSESVLAFRDHLTGYPITTPIIMARPLTIEMQLDSVFGNVSANSRLLERSLSIALNNRNRKVNGLSAAQEVEMLMENARLMVPTNSDTNAMRAALKPFPIDQEHAALRQMLEMSAVVSMMAEEFRVFIAGAPASRTADGSNGSGARNGTNSTTRVSSNPNKRLSNRQPQMFRKPIFFTFRPASQSGTKK